MAPAPSGFSPRYNFTTTWTGDELIVWAGLRGDPATGVNDGAAYVP
jgi:alpha-glucosidase (family GH31 glycosyl hydrolase)